MMIKKQPSWTLWLVLVALTVGVLGCSSKQEGPAANDEAAHKAQQIRLTQRVTQLQQQVATLEKQVADLRAEQERRAQQIQQTATALTSEFIELKKELAGQTGQIPQIGFQPQAQPVEVEADQAPAAAKHVNPLWRFVLAVILLAALWFIGKLFMGRWNEEEDEEQGEDEDDLLGDQADDDDLDEQDEPAEPAADSEEHSIEFGRTVGEGEEEKPSEDEPKQS